MDLLWIHTTLTVLLSHQCKSGVTPLGTVLLSFPWCKSGVTPVKSVKGHWGKGENPGPVLSPCSCSLPEDAAPSQHCAPCSTPHGPMGDTRPRTLGTGDAQPLSPLPGCPVLPGAAGNRPNSRRQHRTSQDGEAMARDVGCHGEGSAGQL